MVLLFNPFYYVLPKMQSRTVRVPTGCSNCASVDSNNTDTTTSTCCTCCTRYTNTYSLVDCCSKQRAAQNYAALLYIQNNLRINPKRPNINKKIELYGQVTIIPIQYYFKQEPELPEFRSYSAHMK